MDQLFGAGAAGESMTTQLHQQIPVRITLRQDFFSSSVKNHRKSIPPVNTANLTYIKPSSVFQNNDSDCTLGPHVTADEQQFPTKSFFVPKIMITNVRSFTPKIEVQEFLNRNDITMAFITEIWLKRTIMDSVINIPR
jgi:hypothetical protein